MEEKPSTTNVEKVAKLAQLMGETDALEQDLYTQYEERVSPEMQPVLSAVFDTLADFPNPEAALKVLDLIAQVCPNPKASKRRPRK